jgi:hypothetical protein
MLFKAVSRPSSDRYCLSKEVLEGTSVPYRVLLVGTELVPGLEFWATVGVTGLEGVTVGLGLGTLALEATTGEAGDPGKFKAEPAYIRFGFLIVGLAFRSSLTVVPCCLAIPERV